MKIRLMCKTQICQTAKSQLSAFIISLICANLVAKNEYLTFLNYYFPDW